MKKIHPTDLDIHVRIQTGFLHEILSMYIIKMFYLKNYTDNGFSYIRNES